MIDHHRLQKKEMIQAASKMIWSNILIFLSIIREKFALYRTSKILCSEVIIIPVNYEMASDRWKQPRSLKIGHERYGYFIRPWMLSCQGCSSWELHLLSRHLPQMFDPLGIIHVISHEWILQRVLSNFCFMRIVDDASLECGGRIASRSKRN